MECRALSQAFFEVVLFVWMLRLLAAVLLLPLAVWAALAADGLAQAILVRLRGGALPMFFQGGDVARLAEEVRGVEDGNFRILPSVVSLSLGLALFLLIPQGRFPPVLGTPIGTILILLLFLLGIGVEALEMSENSTLKPWRVVGESLLGVGRGVPVAFVLGLMSWVAWRTGMPGEPLSVGAFVSKPVWSVIDGMGKVGLFLLCTALVAVLPVVSAGAFVETTPPAKCLSTADGAAPPTLSRIGGSLRGLALAALCVSLFVPFWASLLLGRGALLSAVVDFLLFWIEAVLLRMSAAVVFELLARRLSAVRTVRLSVVSAWLLALGGGALLLAGL